MAPKGNGRAHEVWADAEFPDTAHHPCPNSSAQGASSSDACSFSWITQR